MIITRIYYICGIFLISCTIFVITCNNTVFSLIFLILSFLFASIIFVLLEADFLGLILIVVYVGAIAVLFLFTVMILETKLPVVNRNRQTLVAPIGIVFGVLLFLPAIQTFQITFADIDKYVTPLICAFDYIGIPDAHSLGGVLYSYFAIHVLIVGMILLVVILGVSKLTNSKNRKTKTQYIFKQLSRKKFKIE